MIPVICKPITLVVCSYFKEMGEEFGCCVKSLKSLASIKGSPCCVMILMYKGGQNDGYRILMNIHLGPEV